jgi:hypothetical protein
MNFFSDSVKYIFRQFANGKIPIIGPPLYRFVINHELRIQLLIDTHHKKPDINEQEFANQNLTAVVKTFERPELLKRLIISIKRYYPDLPIIVVDDSKKPTVINGVQTIVLPFDSGVSLGRIEGVKEVKTKYMLLLDDDFIFYRHTNLVDALNILEQYPQIDIMGGQVVNLPYFSSIDYTDGLIYPTSADPHTHQNLMIGDLPVFDIVANFFIGQTEKIRLISWTPELKRIDHNDFFTRAKGVLTTVYNQELKCLHARNPYDTDYMHIRSNNAHDREILKNRYYYAKPNLSD